MGTLLCTREMLLSELLYCVTVASIQIRLSISHVKCEIFVCQNFVPRWEIQVKCCRDLDILIFWLFLNINSSFNKGDEIKKNSMWQLMSIRKTAVISVWVPTRNTLMKTQISLLYVFINFKSFLALQTEIVHTKSA